MPTKASPLYWTALGALAFLVGAPLVAGLVQTIWGGAADLAVTWHAKSLWLTVYTAALTTGLSLLAALGMAACFQRRVRALTLLSLPLLAIPHAAVGQALTLALAPAGFLIRLISPWATGYDRPPNDWLWDQHPDGWTLMAALMVKEVPFFLALIYTQMGNMSVGSWVKTGQALGYSRAAAWWHLVVPNLLPRLLLPTFVVIAFAASVVDVAALVGPSLLKTYAHGLSHAWINDTPRAQTLAGATWLLALTTLMIALTWALSRLCLRQFRNATRWARRPAVAVPYLGAYLGIGIFGLGYLSLLLLPLQSLVETAGRGRAFPDLWPGPLSLEGWASALGQALPSVPLTLLLAALATALALSLALAVLEGEARARRQWLPLDGLILMPLLVPQFAFLIGAAILGIRLALIPAHGFWVAVWWHAIFVLPYVFLVLAPAFRGLDPRLMRAAATLGQSPNQVFWRVKLPILTRAMAYAGAWGMAVSFALYLPTFFASAGRFDTLLTFGLHAMGGRGDSVRAVWGLMLLALPLIGFTGAFLIASLQSRGRQGLKATYA